MKYFKFWPYAVLSFFFRLLIEDIVPLLQIWQLKATWTQKTFFSQKREKNWINDLFENFYPNSIPLTNFTFYQMFSAWLFSFEVNNTQKIVSSCAQVLYSKYSLFWTWKPKATWP
jgi:hypothetical protein